VLYAAADLCVVIGVVAVITRLDPAGEVCAVAARAVLLGVLLARSVPDPPHVLGVAWGGRRDILRIFGLQRVLWLCHVHDLSLGREVLALWPLKVRRLCGVLVGLAEVRHGIRAYVSGPKVCLALA